MPSSGPSLSDQAGVSISSKMSLNRDVAGVEGVSVDPSVIEMDGSVSVSLGGLKRGTRRARASSRSLR